MVLRLTGTFTANYGMERLMGQYFVAVNMDPVALDDVAGSWSWCKVVIIGYYDSSDLYHEAFVSYKDVSFDAVRIMVEDAYTKDVMGLKLEPQRLEGLGSLMADPEEQDFYKEVFGG